MARAHIDLSWLFQGKSPEFNPDYEQPYTDPLTGNTSFSDQPVLKKPGFWDRAIDPSGASYVDKMNLQYQMASKLEDQQFQMERGQAPIRNALAVAKSNALADADWQRHLSQFPTLQKEQLDTSGKLGRLSHDIGLEYYPQEADQRTAAELARDKAIEDQKIKQRTTVATLMRNAGVLPENLKGNSDEVNAHLLPDFTSTSMLSGSTAQADINNNVPTIQGLNRGEMARQAYGQTTLRGLLGTPGTETLQADAAANLGLDQAQSDIRLLPSRETLAQKTLNNNIRYQDNNVTPAQELELLRTQGSLLAQPTLNRASMYDAYNRLTSAAHGGIDPLQVPNSEYLPITSEDGWSYGNNSVYKTPARRAYEKMQEEMNLFQGGGASPAKQAAAAIGLPRITPTVPTIGSQPAIRPMVGASIGAPIDSMSLAPVIQPSVGADFNIMEQGRRALGSSRPVTPQQIPNTESAPATISSRNTPYSQAFHKVFDSVQNPIERSQLSDKFLSEIAKQIGDIPTKYIGSSNIKRNPGSVLKELLSDPKTQSEWMDKLHNLTPDQLHKVMVKLGAEDPSDVEQALSRGDIIKANQLLQLHK